MSINMSTLGIRHQGVHSTPSVDRKSVDCRKVIVAPYVVIDNKQAMFLIVKDRTHKEWTFITGGCKNSETELESAIRELYEETKSIVNMTHLKHLPLEELKSMVRTFCFSTTYREPYQKKRDISKGEVVVTHYTMFFINITKLKLLPEDIRVQFRLMKNVKGVYNENLDLCFDTIDNFLHKAYVWRFIKQVVVRIPMFREIYRSLQTEN